MVEGSRDRGLEELHGHDHDQGHEGEDQGVLNQRLTGLGGGCAPRDARVDSRNKDLCGYGDAKKFLFPRRFCYS